MVKTLLALIVCLCLATPGIAAQVKSPTKKAPRPAWSELTPAQQEVLAPLAPEWDQLNTTRRKKWVAIADRYPTMKPSQQKRLQTRMQKWVQLTPEEREAADAGVVEDDPADAELTGARAPLLSALCPDAEHPEWDTAVWEARWR